MGCWRFCTLQSGRQYTKCTTVTHKMAKITQNLKSRSNIGMLK